MNLRIPLSLCFCLLACVVSGSPADEKPASETLELEHLTDDHHMLKLIGHFKDFVRSQSACPPLWLPFKGHCYRYVDCSKTFEAAENECQSYGQNSHLVSVHTVQEKTFVASSVIPSGEKVNIWIGMLNRNQNCNEWKWKDGSQVNFFSWTDPMPDSCRGKDVCVQLSVNSNFENWIAVDCESPATYICEKPL